MKKPFQVWSLAALVSATLSFAPQSWAHERDTFKVGDKFFVFIIGSLDEPSVVDNMSGVELRVSQVEEPGGAGTTRGKDNGTPVTGLEQTLKVELAAGDKTKTLSLEPSDEATGSYTANFIPTVQTTYTYRLFGTINASPVDLTFACVPGEVSETSEDNSQVKVSSTIIRVNKVGAFGCPAGRKAMGFPEPALSSQDIYQNTRTLEASARTAIRQATEAQALSIVAIVFGFSGVVAGIIWRRKKAA